MIRLTTAQHMDLARGDHKTEIKTLVSLPVWEDVEWFQT